MALFSDIPTVDSLLRQVDQLQDAVDEDILERLTEENSLLEKSIEYGRHKLMFLSNILREAFEGYVVLNAYLENFERDTHKISEDWAMSILYDDTVKNG
jgi:hypothetical protein